MSNLELEEMQKNAKVLEKVLSDFMQFVEPNVDVLNSNSKILYKTVLPFNDSYVYSTEVTICGVDRKTNENVYLILNEGLVSVKRGDYVRSVNSNIFNWAYWKKGYKAE